VRAVFAMLLVTTFKI